MDAVATMTLGETVKWSIGILLSLSAIIQISPIKINPWSYAAKIIGRAINSEMIEKIDKINNDLTKFKEITDERNAELLRSHILRFGDELLHGTKHSKEHFDQILSDITSYNEYCDTHPNFKNDMTRLTTEHIKNTYRECMDKHSFL